MIPAFPDFREIELSDRATLEDYFRRNPPLISEMTFTNLFAWRKVCGYLISRFRDGLLILRRNDRHLSFLPPLVSSNLPEAVDACFKYLRAEGQEPLLERVGEDFLAGDPVLLERYEVREDRDNFDYLHEVRQLIELRGRLFHDKRNNLNQFRKKYEYRFLPLTPDRIPDCLNLVHQWCREKDCDEDQSLFHEKSAVLEMLENFTALGARGGLIEVDGNLAALTLGEPLNRDTFVIHVEKGMGNIEGIYQAVNREFLLRLEDQFLFVNREQDLGIEGLRRAKESYNPVRMIKKYTLHEKNAAI
jgi:hypothetical protein